jgi:hypothetical protein
VDSLCKGEERIIGVVWLGRQPGPLSEPTEEAPALKCKMKSQAFKQKGNFHTELYDEIK